MTRSVVTAKVVLMFALDLARWVIIYLVASVPVVMERMRRAVQVFVVTNVQPELGSQHAVYAHQDTDFSVENAFLGFILQFEEHLL